MPSSVEKQRILLVEDDRSSRLALDRLLTMRGFEVFSSATVAEGLAALSHQPRYIILDLMLPDGSGESILEELRNMGLSSKVIVTTGVSDPVRLEALRNLGAAAVLRKPVNLGQLVGYLANGA